MNHLKRILLLFFCFLFTCSFSDNLVPVKIAYVIDGDTYKVWYQGKKQSVRLIGIDTPESKRNNRAELQSRQFGKDIEEIIELGKQTKKYAMNFIKAGQTIYLEFDVRQTDRYGRLLAYVWLDKEKTRMINEILIQDGYAVVYTVPPDVKYAERLLQAQKQARENKRGLWEIKRRSINNAL